MKKEEARKLTNKQKISPLSKILDNIKNTAKEGKNILHIYDHLDNDVLHELKKLGFIITTFSGLAQQKEGLYYSISW